MWGFDELLVHLQCVQRAARSVPRALALDERRVRRRPGALKLLVRGHLGEMRSYAVIDRSLSLQYTLGAQVMVQRG